MDKAPVRLRFKIGSTPEPPVEEEDKEANSDHDEQVIKLIYLDN